MNIRTLLAVRGWPAVFAWSLASVALLGGLYAANVQIAYDATRTEQRWGSGTTGSVIANSGNNAGITTALIRFTGTSGGDQEITRIMPATATIGTPVQIWEDTLGEVFVQGSATGNRYKMWHTVPGPNPAVTYLIYLAIAAMIARCLFAVGESFGYLLTRHRI